MSRFGKRNALGVVLAASLLAAGCGGGSGSGSVGDSGEKVLKVGLFLPQVGPFAGIAKDQANGFRNYVENLKGGMLSGYKVEIVPADTANDPAVARENVQRLVERDKVDAVVGIISSAVAYSVAPYLQESGVPVIFTATAADDLTQRRHAPNFFRTSTSSSQLMMPLGSYACKTLGYRTATMVSLDYAFGYEAMGGFARSYEDAGCKIVQELYSPLGTADWAPVVQQIKKDVDVVVQTTSGSDAVKFLQAYRDFGLTDIPQLANGFGTDLSTLPEPAQRELATKLQSVAYYAEALDTPANQQFQKSFREKYAHTPGIYAEATYVAGMVLEAALASGQKVDHAGLTAAIGKVQIDAPRGPLKFDQYGQAILPSYLRVMKDNGAGELTNHIVKPIAQDASQFWTYDPQEYLKLPPYTELKGTWARG